MGNNDYAHLVCFSEIGPRDLPFAVIIIGYLETFPVPAMQHQDKPKDDALEMQAKSPTQNNLNGFFARHPKEDAIK